LDFFRFPHTPHLAWLGEGFPRDDKVLSRAEADALLAGPVRVEEKLDGANLGLSYAPDGRLRAQNRGQYLIRPYSGQFSRLGGWLSMHEWQWRERLAPNLILFGEWCAAVHSLDYTELPDWFLLFDVYDRDAQGFWSARRRDTLAASLGLALVPLLHDGQTDLRQLIKLVNSARSRFRDGPLEGVVIRSDFADWCESRAKLVRTEFTQVISEHWRSRPIAWNRICVGSER